MLACGPAPDGEVVGHDDHVYVAADVEVAARYRANDEGRHEAVVRGESLHVARGELDQGVSLARASAMTSAMELIPGRVHEWMIAAASDSASRTSAAA